MHKKSHSEIIQTLHIKEQRFLEIIAGLRKITHKDYPELTYYEKNGKMYFNRDEKNRYLWCEFNQVWTVFENEFSMTHNEIRLFIKDMGEKHLRWNSLTPAQCNQIIPIWYRSISI